MAVFDKLRERFSRFSTQGWYIRCPTSIRNLRVILVTSHIILGDIFGISDLVSVISSPAFVL